MRAIYYSDVTAAARALCSVASYQRADLCKQMIREADIADRFTRRLGKAHLVFGRGTLHETATLRACVPEPGFDDQDYCASMVQVLELLCLRPRSAHM